MCGEGALLRPNRSSGSPVSTVQGHWVSGSAAPDHPAPFSLCVPYSAQEMQILKELVLCKYVSLEITGHCGSDADPVTRC